MKPQSAPGLVFADCIELLHFSYKEYNQSVFSTDHLVTSMYTEYKRHPSTELSLVLSEEGVCYDQCGLLAILC